jgi:hypothetical protein
MLLYVITMLLLWLDLHTDISRSNSWPTPCLYMTSAEQNQVYLSHTFYVTRRLCFRVFPSPRHTSNCDAAQQESSWWCDLPPAIHSAHTTPSRYLTTSTNEPNATTINPNFPVGQKSCHQIVHVYISPSSWLLTETHPKHQIQLHNHTRSRSINFKICHYELPHSTPTITPSARERASTYMVPERD